MLAVVTSADDTARTAFDAVIEIFTWLGFAAALLLGLAALIAWAADGSWLAAEAIVDRDGPAPLARWYDAHGRARSAALTPADAAALGVADTATVWYRLGPHDRVRLTARPVGLRALAWAAVGAAGLGVVCFVSGIAMLFAG